MTKAFEAFSSKDVRTCARILSKLHAVGYSVDDLPSAVEVLGRIGLSRMSLRFPTQLPILGPGSTISAQALMEAAGWRFLRSWLRFKRLSEKVSLGLEEMKVFAAQGRRKHLEQIPAGRVGT